MLPSRFPMDSVRGELHIEKLVERGVPRRMAALAFTAPDASTFIRQAWHNSHAPGEEQVPRTFSLRLVTALVTHMLDALIADFYPSKAVESIFGVRMDSMNLMVSPVSSWPPDLSNRPIGNLMYGVWQTILSAHDDDCFPGDCGSTQTLCEEMMEALLRGSLPAVFEQLVRTSSKRTNGIEELEKRGFHTIYWDHESIGRIAEGFMSVGQRVELSTFIVNPSLEGQSGKLVKFVEKVTPDLFSKPRISNRWLVALDGGKYILAKSTNLKLLSPPFFSRWALLAGLEKKELNGAIGEILHNEDSGRVQFRPWKLTDPPSLRIPLPAQRHVMHESGMYGKPAYTGPITRRLLAQEPRILVKPQNVKGIDISDLVPVVCLSGLETTTGNTESVSEDIQVPRHLSIFNGEPMVTYEPVHIMRQVGVFLGVVLVSLPDRIVDPIDNANPLCAKLMATSTGSTAPEWDSCGPVLVFRPDCSAFRTADMKLVLRFIHHFCEKFNDHLEGHGEDAADAWRDEWLTADTFEAWKRHDSENANPTKANMQEHIIPARAFPETDDEFDVPQHENPVSAGAFPDTDDEFEAPHQLTYLPTGSTNAPMLGPSGNMCSGGCRPCTNMLRTGRCRRGDRCDFCHFHGPDPRYARPPRSARIRSKDTQPRITGMVHGPGTRMVGALSEPTLGRLPTVGADRIGSLPMNAMQVGGQGMQTRRQPPNIATQLVWDVLWDICKDSRCACSSFLMIVLLLCYSSHFMVMLVATLVCILIGMTVWRSVSASRDEQ